MTLTEAERKRGLAALLIDTFLMWGGFFMVVPLISVHYVDRLGWSAASIGLVLALRQFTQQGSTPVSGILADRLGAKGLICTGLLIRAVGFAAMAWATTFPLLLGAALLAAIGGGLFESPKNAAVAALTTPTNRRRYYSLIGVIGGLGVAIGTQVGALLLPFDFALVALAAAGCFVTTFLITLLLLPRVQVATERQGLTYGIGLALRDRPFMHFNVLLMGYWFMWVQMSISVSLAARALSGDERAVSWVYGINSAVTVLLQYPLLRLSERWLQPLPTLIVGVLLMAGGLGSIALAGNMPVLLGCVGLFAVGGVLATPSQQTVTAGLSNQAALGSYFGVNSLALAIGGGLGNLGGGWLYDMGKQHALPALPWLVFAGVGLAAAAGLGLMALRQHATQRVQPLQPTTK